MKSFNWFMIGFRYKRWLTGGFVGVFLIALALAVLMKDVVLGPIQIASAGFLTLCGIVCILIFVKRIVLKLLNIYPTGLYKKPGNVKEISDVLLKRKTLSTGPKIVVIGGGTGISTMLRGLKQFTSNITAIITVMDDGGGS